MNKNEFAEKLVKEFSVKHPNYSASVKKPEEEPVTDDVCAMFQKNSTAAFLLFTLIHCPVSLSVQLIKRNLFISIIKTRT